MEVKRERDPPRILEQDIEKMFELAGLRGLQFYASEFAIETVEYADRQSDDDCGAEMACREKDSSGPRDDVAENRQLIRRDGDFAESADDQCLDRRVDERGDVERSLLGRIEDHLFGKFLVRLGRRWEPVSAQIAMQLGGIPGPCRRVEGGETSIVQFCADSLLERTVAAGDPIARKQGSPAESTALRHRRG